MDDMTTSRAGIRTYRWESICPFRHERGSGGCTMKKRLLWTLVFTFLLMLLCGAALAEPWTGSGTEADPWRIRTAADLVALRERIGIGNSYWGNHFLLEKDINLDDYCGQDKGNWVPIGKYNGIRLNGTFDGGSHKITGLFIDSNSNYQGLFASTWS